MRWMRSTTTPPKNGSTIIGTAKLNPSRPSHSGELVSCRTSQPWATFCIHVPTLETINPDQIKAKFRCCKAAKRGASDRVEDKRPPRFNDTPYPGILHRAPHSPQNGPFPLESPPQPGRLRFPIQGGSFTHGHNSRGGPPPNRHSPAGFPS